MQYLVFGVLLILGAVFVGLFVYIHNSRNRIDVTVIESYSDVKKNGQYIEKLSVVHKVSYEGDNVVHEIETDVFPVRELKGVKIKAYFDKNKQEFYHPDYAKYWPLLGAFFVCGIACLAVFVADVFDFSLYLSEIELIALLSAVIAIVSCSEAATVIQPAVVKTKGNFEAFLKTGDKGEEAEVYSLWYGEHRQYAKRKKGMNLRVNPEKTVLLFYNTKTGTVSRAQETVLSMCVSVVAFVAMLIILLI